MDLQGKRVLVMGLGESGLSMAKWLARRGAAVRLADSRPAPPSAQTLAAMLPGVALHLGGWRDDDFAGIDLIAISPGVPRETPQVQRALAAGTPVLGDVELFAQSLNKLRPGAVPARPGVQRARPLVIAITGTNGKTTVTSLCGAMCRAAGLDCEVAGNISPAVLDAAMAREDAGRPAAAWVLELSSFQLESTSSLDPDAAVMLNLTEDHLDRYASMRDYGAAKARIFAGRGVQVLNRDDAASLAMALPGRACVTFGLDAPPTDADYGLLRAEGKPWLAKGATRLMPVDGMQLAGLHNAANALAALALCQAIGLPLDPLLAALSAFRGLPHRVEWVAEVAGVRYYDDSKGTNVGSTVAALAGLTGARPGARVVLIAGGEGKGQDFSPLKEALASTARALVLIGRDAPLIELAVAGNGVPVLHAASMQAAVEAAASAAQRGDAVLLSPACASFDMFRDYKHRGDVFRAAVEGKLNG